MHYGSGSWWIIVLGLGLLLADCTSPQRSDFMEAYAASPKAGLVAETEKIIPGQRIGKVTLGEKFTEVEEKFGKADALDATLGHSWAVWNLTDQPVLVGAQRNSELDVYSVRSSGENRKMYVQQIRITAPAFSTPLGAGPGSPADHIKRTYPNAKAVARYYSSELKATITIYDDIAKGIAFELAETDDPDKSEDVCIAVLVHNPGQVVTDTYLPFYPLLELLAGQP